MKIFLSFIFCCCGIGVFGQNQNPNYDEALAQKLGADDYGMKAYVLGIYTSGSNVSEDKEARSAAFRGHLNNIERMVKAGKLIVAGPFGKNNYDYRGLLIFNVETLEEAQELLAEDPAVQAKYLDFQLVPWYGSAALPEYLEASDKVWKKQP
ncbi:YciI family protein [Marinilongibacter aquaticus]|uniref:YciI family protein n=1 Tax=Marinilongibacter aquaticus TaxID=2975157 RepID=UPI0021BD5736|nr:YciI family protein [Marinilongibacter aquaticus]UBM60579.1 YciI family protein [Marinilongibacter aquaticus]